MQVKEVKHSLLLHFAGTCLSIGVFECKRQHWTSMLIIQGLHPLMLSPTSFTKLLQQMQWRNAVLHIQGKCRKG